MKPSLVITPLALAAVLAVPGTAAAATTGAVAGTNLTLTGDAAADAITITAAGGQLQHNLPTGAGTFASAVDFDSAQAGVQALAADGTANMTIAAGDGNDTVTVNLAAGELATATIDGGGGDDLLTGSARGDAVRGGDGDDRVVGGRGDDDMEGGAGNDVLVWNNGDGSDVIDGDAGADTTEVNGAATAGDAFVIAPTGQRVRFDRTNLVPFTLDTATERMTVNGLGGDDAMTGAAGLAALTLVTLDGGSGADTLTGGDGADLVTGGDDADVLDGGAGDDRLVGDRGADTMRGGAGEDVLVWNNGDGSDVMDGQDGSDTIEVNGAPAGGDAFTLAANGPRAKFDRTNLVPFTLDVGSSEILDVRAGGGDDSFAAAAGTAGLLGTLAVDGGAGADVLRGGDSADLLAGGPGADQLDGGAGSDTVDGGEGDDRLTLRDARADLGFGGAGADSATADAAGIDVLDGIEAVDAPAAADKTATPVRIATTTARIRRGAVRLRVTCPAAEAGGCRGSLTLATQRSVRVGRLRAVVVLGSARVSLRPGQARTVRVRLVANARSLASRGRIAARATAEVRDRSGNRSTATRRVTIRTR